MRKFDVKSIMLNKTLRIAATAIFTVIMLTGCVNLLEDYKEVITEHQSVPYVRPPVQQTTVSDYDEFFSVILRAVMNYETDVNFLYYHRDTDEIHEDIQRVRQEIMYEHPIGAYMVASITANETRIVTHYEVDVEIQYKRTREQLESIVNTSTEQILRLQLLRKMSEYSEVAVFRTRIPLDEEIIASFVRDTYYRNPHQIVMLPMITVETFPETGADRIYEIHFSNSESSMMLQQFGELLTSYIQRNAELAEGNTDSEVLLSLSDIFIDSITFNERAARTIHVHGAQNLAATAFGALVRGNAVGEGFAMAFKAIADELEFDCRVVLGEMDGLVHAWNIIYLYGDYYHIDIAMSVVLGKEAAFLKTDADFEEMLYIWDRENTVKCEGELTLEDILGEDDPDDGDENGDENGEDTDESNEEEEYLHERRKRVL